MPRSRIARRLIGADQASQRRALHLAPARQARAAVPAPVGRKPSLRARGPTPGCRRNAAATSRAGRARGAPCRPPPCPPRSHSRGPRRRASANSRARASLAVCAMQPDRRRSAAASRRSCAKIRQRRRRRRAASRRNAAASRHRYRARAARASLHATASCAIACASAGASSGQPGRSVSLSVRANIVALLCRARRCARPRDARATAQVEGARKKGAGATRLPFRLVPLAEPRVALVGNPAGYPMLFGRFAIMSTEQNFRPSLPSLERHAAVDEREQGMVLAHADVAARIEFGAALAHEDVAGDDASPPNFFTPRRRPAESRPLREEPPAFLCAISNYSLLTPSRGRGFGLGGGERRPSSAFGAAFFCSSCAPIATIFRIVCCWRWPFLRR